MPADPRLAAYAEHTAATPTDLTRLRARVRGAQAQSSRGWLPYLAGTGALAFAAVLAIGSVDTAPAPVTASFDGTSTGASLEVAPGVAITAAGTGELTGTEQAPRLAWAAGSVEVSVEPGAGLDVQVATDEALVKVVGTVFQVERGPLGTTVGVTRGKVAVSCANGTEHSLTADTTTTCWPTTATGLLGRAQAQRTGGASVEGVMATVERGLAAGPDATIRTELAALQVVLLAESGSAGDAIAAATAHLSQPDSGRRAEVARVGAALGYAASGCSGAEPFIADLPAEEVAASALSMCHTAGEGNAPR